MYGQSMHTYGAYAHGAHAPQPAPALPPAQPPVPPSAVVPAGPEVVDAARLMQPPHRASRPSKIMIVMRGLPGSGKSTLARKLRELEVEAGSEPPRVHSIDDYFMQEEEVEVVEEEGGRKKRRKVSQLKYTYDADMEAAYFKDLVRAVGRTCEDRRHSFVVVDAPNMRLDGVKELVAVAQRTNFEPYVLQPLESDVAVCAQRNTHGRTPAELQALAEQWEPPSALYTCLDASSLLSGAGGSSSGGGGSSTMGGDRDQIQEVNMDHDADGDDKDAGGGSSDREASGSSRWGSASKAARTASGSGLRREGGSSAVRVDDSEILSDLNDMLSSAAAAAADQPTATDGDGPGAASTCGQRAAPAPGGGKSPPAGILRSASSGCLPSARTKPKRVRWPDMDEGMEDASNGGGNGSGALDSDEGGSSGAVQPLPRRRSTGQLAEVVVLDGLGPAPELQDLPYGYQKKAGAAAQPALHERFIVQAKAEHNAEHDLFKQLLLGKQVRGAAAMGSSLFAAPGEGEEADEP